MFSVQYIHLQNWPILCTTYKYRIKRQRCIEHTYRSEKVHFIHPRIELKYKNKKQTAWKCKMTFTYTGAWVPTPTEPNVTVGGKQESPANICTVDSEVYRQHFHSRQPYFQTPLSKKGYSSFQEIPWIPGLQIKVPNWVKHQNQRSTWLHQLANDRNMTSRSLGV